MAVWVQLPMVGEPAAVNGSSSSSSSGGGGGAYDGAFDCWNQLFTLCEQNTLLGGLGGGGVGGVVFVWVVCAAGGERVSLCGWCVCVCGGGVLWSPGA